MAKAGNTSYPKEKIRILFLENISDVAVKNFHRHGYDKVAARNCEFAFVEWLLVQGYCTAEDLKSQRD